MVRPPTTYRDHCFDDAGKFRCYTRVAAFVADVSSIKPEVAAIFLIANDLRLHDACSMRAILFAASLSCALLATRAAEAQDPTTVWVSPGAKLSWTFGQGFRGLTLGAELSLVHIPAYANTTETTRIGKLLDRGMFIGWGPVLSVDWLPWKAMTILHLGAEWVGPAIGLDMGPSIIFEPKKTYFGLGFTPWVGAVFVPYYNYTVVFKRPKNLHQFGIMGKLPVCASSDTACADSGSSGGGGSHWDWD